MTATVGLSYRSRWVPHGHPLETPRSQTVGEHRVVLWDVIGPGVHECHWCGELVAWHPKPDEHLLEVDHLDNDVRNNDEANLVPSCRWCNQKRGRDPLWCERLRSIRLEAVAS